MSEATSSLPIIGERAPNGAKLLQFRGGDSIKATASSIAFLWSNWDVLFRISKGYFHAEKTAAAVWQGGGFGGKGVWYMASPFIGINEGRFEFYSLLRFLGTPVRGTSIFEYRRSSEGTFYYSGRSWGEIPPRLSRFRWFIEALGNIAAARFNAIGGGTAELISRQPSIVRDHCDAEIYQLFLGMIEEENEIVSGNKIRNFRFFSPKLYEELLPQSDPLGDLRRDLENLKSKLEKAGSLVDFSMYRQSIDLFLVDPDSALVKARTIMEQIVALAYVSTFHRSPGEHQTMNEQIHELNSTKKISKGVISMMRTVNGLGNTGAHFNRTPNIIDLAQFKTSFNASLGVTAWFYNRQT